MIALGADLKLWRTSGAAGESESLKGYPKAMAGEVRGHASNPLLGRMQILN